MSRIVCPFCSLHCDDVITTVAETDSEDFGIKTLHRCSLAEQGLQSALNPPPPRIGDNRFEASRWDSLVPQVAQQLESLDAPPLVSLRSATIELGKQLDDLMQQGRLRLSIPQSPSEQAWDQAVGRETSLTATLGDALVHADLVYSLGDLADSLPRLATRFTDHQLTVHSLPTLTLPVMTRLNQALHQPGGKTVAEETVEPLLQQMQTASYTVFLVGPNAFESASATVLAEQFCRWVAAMNRPAKSDAQLLQRAVCLRFDPLQSIRNVFRWRRNDITGLAPKTGPVSIRLGNCPSADTEQRALIQIGGDDPGRLAAEIFLPAEQAGIQRSGTVIRGDGTVTLPLVSATATRNLPSTSEWLDKLFAEIS